MVSDEKSVMKPKTPPKVKYNEVSGSMFGSIKNSLPKELIPTAKLGYAFGVIFLLVVLYGIATFPLGKMMSGIVEGLEITIGLPWPFLVFDLANPTTAPIRIAGLIWDLLVYLVLSYAIDVALSLFLNSPLFESEEDKKKRPEVFRDINGKKISNAVAETYVRELNNKKLSNPSSPQGTEEIKKSKVNSRTTFVQEDGWFKQKELE